MIPVGTLPYGDAVIDKYAKDHGYNYTAEAAKQAGGDGVAFVNNGGSDIGLLGSGASAGDGACFGGQPTPISMGEYVTKVMEPDVTVNGAAPVDEGIGRGVPYTFGRTNKDLYEHMQFDLADLPHHLYGAPCFKRGFHSRSAIGIQDVAVVEPQPCVWPITCLSGIRHLLPVPS
jgi:hypothetical protein